MLKLGLGIREPLCPWMLLEAIFQCSGVRQAGSTIALHGCNVVFGLVRMHIYKISIFHAVCLSRGMYGYIYTFYMLTCMHIQTR